MRWLLIKDLRILRRSPLLVGLLILYPVVVAILIGAALTGGPEKPRVAFANLAGDATSTSAGRRSTPATYTSRFFEAVDPIRVNTREEAIEKVRERRGAGRARDPRRRDRAPAGHALARRRRPPTVEVFYNAEDPVKRRYVESTIRSRLAEANAAL